MALNEDRFFATFKFTHQVVEKRHERRQYKAIFSEIAELMPISEHFELNITLYCQAQ